MIGSLRGTLAERDLSGSVVIDVGGVGYAVNVTTQTVATSGEIGSEVSLRIHTRVREDSITLFGFSTGEEKRCFEALIATHGVGPSLAMALLSMHSPIALRHIVASEDIDELSKVPGVGKKTATRLLVELKTKFDVDLDAELIDIDVKSSSSSNAKNDVSSALTGLGYSRDEIRRVLASLPADAKTEDLLRMALKELAVAS